MIMQAYLYADTAYVSGEWRTPMATHEYSVAIDKDGRWLRADIVEYGEWDVITDEADARDRLRAHEAEIDEAARKEFSNA